MFKNKNIFIIVFILLLLSNYFNVLMKLCYRFSNAENSKVANKPIITKNNSNILKLFRKVNSQRTLDTHIQSNRFVIPPIKERISAPLFDNPKINNNIINYNKNLLKQQIQFISKRNKINESSISPIFVSDLTVPDVYQFHNKLVKNSQKKYIDRTHSKEYSISAFDEQINDDTQDSPNNIRFLLIKKSQSSENIIERFREKRLSQKKIPKDIQKILIKEMEDANIKMQRNNSFSSRKSVSKPQNNNNNQSICLQKLRRYSYVAKNNPLLEINKEGKLPNILRDGEFIKELMNNGFSKISTCKKPSYI